MKKIIYLTIYLVALFLGNCKKEEVTKEVPPVAPPSESVKLDYYTENIFLEGYGIQSGLKTQYEYDASGKLTRHTVFGYNLATTGWEELRHVVFTQANGHVAKIEEYLVNTDVPILVDSYEYLPDGRVSKIKEINNASEVISEADFTYSPDSTIMVTYAYSNGAGSEYRFLYTGQDIRHDRMTQGGELCNNGDFTYDTKVNPFHKLGYVDFALVNFSKNNLLTANVVYVSCSTPTFIQDTHVYEYNAKGYPTLVTATYKNDDRLTSERRFYYKP